MYESIRITTCSTNSMFELNQGTFYFTHDDSQLEIYHHLTLKDAWKELYALEVRLGRKAEHTVNPLDNSIEYWELHGYVG